MYKQKVLIIEDDPAILMGLMDNFEMEGYEVKTACDGESGLAKALSWRPDLILLDIMMPKKNGYEVLDKVRREGLNMPIILFTAKSEEDDIVRGLKLGADGYVTKPFSLRELLARANAFLRRCSNVKDKLSFGEFELDLNGRRLICRGEEIGLMPKEFTLLELMVSNPGKAFSRDELMDKVWQGVQVSTRSVDRCVTTLRSKIESVPSQPQHILTIRDFGYRFEV